MRPVLYPMLVFGCACASNPPPEPALVAASASVEESPGHQDSRAAPRTKAKTVRRPPVAETEAEQTEASSTPVAESAPAVAQTNRCVTGAVRARGDIVVAVNNATVAFFRGEQLLGETRTDTNGKFAWCAGRNLAGRFELTVTVSKEPFRTISQRREWVIGVQEEFDFALNAPEIAD